ncbi:binding--dependent transport system inner membrane component family protein [Pseudarthrobacter siccitolerans]|uniref:Binding--dependent transport system inner membrane component family protein n=1 Tax=Pseudarthrobacter siccitolerans TaxID=861266 RepID=A0A024H2R5_9MICC|nr:ABC transporter permease [Pseudarthrobacter siccitolerans]CCQ46187.1 binding--dependent transport system inner membrane component family protein [Pseudarthrobacter siccitolerans]
MAAIAKADTLVVTEGTPDYNDNTILTERRQARIRQELSVWALRIGALAVFVFSWSFVTGQGLVDATLVSTPGDVGTSFIKQLGDGTFWVDVAATFSGAMAGLVSGAILGILAGVVFTRIEVLHVAARPFLTLMNSLPRPALAPIFILWFGLGFGPKALVAFSVVFFVLMTSTMGALQGIDHDIKQLTKSLGMTRRQRFFKIELPSALPSIVGGLRLGAVYSVLGAVVSEMVGAYTGLGQRLVVVTNNFQVSETFAILLAMGLLSMILDLSISGLQKLVTKWTR